METNFEAIVVTQEFKVSPEILWETITNHEIMLKWYFDNIPDFQAQVGFETRFNVVSGERNFMHIWKVTEVIPLKRIVYNWTFDDYEGSADLSMEIYDENDHTRLVVTDTILESFPQDIPEFKRESAVAGWQYFINQRLKNFLS
ncbi:MAG: SRPBCC domain-containing protein [Flavobacteriaceae bacterium]|nr:SRPBCC domain-containing protein [Flavobacteriaceae bacterium]